MPEGRGSQNGPHPKNPRSHPRARIVNATAFEQAFAEAIDALYA